MYELDGTPRLLIHPALFARIHCWHRKHPNKEWSGQLLYTKTSANILEYDEIEIEALDFIPYDLGNAVYTNINLHNSDIANILDYIPDYWSDERCENEELAIQKGVIHTHHNMATFFSTTDQPNLLNNSANFVGTMYVSLIVNKDYNWNKPQDRWKARIAWHTKPCSDRKGVHVLMHDTEVIAELDAPAVFWVECGVTWEFERGNSLDEHRYAELNPKWLESVASTVYCNRPFMAEFYKRLTQGKFDHLDGQDFVNYIDSYTDIYDWFTDEVNSIIDDLIDKYDLSTIYTEKLGIEDNKEFAKVKVVQTLLEDLRNFGTKKQYKRFKIKFGNLIKTL